MQYLGMEKRGKLCGAFFAGAESLLPWQSLQPDISLETLNIKHCSCSGEEVSALT
jgi:hypothetical protein